MINTKVGGNIGYLGFPQIDFQLENDTHKMFQQYLFHRIFVPHNKLLSITIIFVYGFPPKFKFRASSQSVALKRQKKFHETIRKVNYGYCMTLGCSAQNYTRHICERAIQ